jgi:hypothetical protein
MQRNDGPSKFAEVRRFGAQEVVTPAVSADLAIRLDDFQT